MFWIKTRGNDTRTYVLKRKRTACHRRKSYSSPLTLGSESGLSSANATKERDNNEARKRWLRSRSAKPDSRDSIVGILFKWPFMPVNAAGVGKVCLTRFSSGEWRNLNGTWRLTALRTDRVKIIYEPNFLRYQTIFRGFFFHKKQYSRSITSCIAIETIFGVDLEILFDTPMENKFWNDIIFVILKFFFKNIVF